MAARSLHHRLSFLVWHLPLRMRWGRKSEWVMTATNSQPHYIYSILFMLFLLILICTSQAATPVANFTANVTSGAKPLPVCLPIFR